MKCDNCKAEWTVRDEFHKNLHRCPFCGKKFNDIKSMDSIPIETSLIRTKFIDNVTENSHPMKIPKFLMLLLCAMLVFVSMFLIIKFKKTSIPTATEQNNHLNSSVITPASNTTSVKYNQMNLVHVNHNYSEATCMTPMTCTECGLTSGNALGHNYSNATCTSAKTCKRCGKTDGNPLPHNWSQATCISQSFCLNCGKTTGSYGNHNWREATYDYPDTCTICGQTRGSPKKRPLSASLSTYESGSRIPNNQISVYASSCEPAGKYGNYYASNANDSNPKTEWVEGAYGSNAIGKGERLTFNFSRRSITGFVIQAGMFRSKESFDRNCRPATIRIHMDNVSPLTITLNDIMKNQVVLFSYPVNTSSLSIELCTFYTNGVDPNKGLATCIADVWILQD